MIMKMTPSHRSRNRFLSVNIKKNKKTFERTASLISKLYLYWNGSGFTTGIISSTKNILKIYNIYHVTDRNFNGFLYAATVEVASSGRKENKWNRIVLINYKNIYF